MNASQPKFSGDVLEELISSEGRGVVLIPANPGEPITMARCEEAPGLAELQRHVEGYIETVSVLFNGRMTTMVVNEEGMVRNLTLNWRASCVYTAGAITARGLMPRSPICGNAVLLVNLEMK